VCGHNTFGLNCVFVGAILRNILILSMKERFCMSWLEELPDNCPPEDATAPSEFECYRIVWNNVPNDKDFHSYKKLFPNRNFTLSECRVCSASILTDSEDAKRVLGVIPDRENRKIVRLTLEKGAGLIKHTPSRTRLNLKSHHSWWVKQDYRAFVKIDEDK